MILTVQYRGKPLTLRLQEHVEILDSTFETLGGPEVVSIRRLDGEILDGMPDELKPGDEICIRSRGLHARFYLLQTGSGAIRSNGIYRLPKMARVA